MTTDTEIKGSTARNVLARINLTAQQVMRVLPILRNQPGRYSDFRHLQLMEQGYGEENCAECEDGTCFASVELDEFEQRFKDGEYADGATIFQLW